MNRLLFIAALSSQAWAQSPSIIIKPLPTQKVTWQIQLNAESNKVSTSGQCSFEYKGLVLSRSAFEGTSRFATKGTFKLNTNIREVQMRCAVKGFQPLVETVPVDRSGLKIERDLTDYRIFQTAQVDLDQGIAKVHLKIPEFRREKVNVGGKTFLRLSTSDKEISSSSYTGEAHMPEFPQTSFYIALPLDAQIASLKITPGPVVDGVNSLLVPKVDEGEAELQSGIKPIFNDKIYFGLKPEVLASRDAKFEAVVDREKNLVKISVPLVDYAAKQGTVRFYSDMDITLSFKAGSRCFRPPFRGLDAVDALRSKALVGLKQLVLNPQDVQKTCSDSLVLRAATRPTVIPNLVIVAPEKFKAQAQDLAAHKESLGIRTAILDWNGGSAVELKSVLENAAAVLRPNFMQWVLLLGDVDAIPTYYDTAPGFSDFGDHAHTAGDAYYVQWGATAETYAPSKDPDSSIGRIPAKTSEELQIMIDRIRNYDNNPPMVDSFYQSPTIAGTMQMDDFDPMTGLDGNYAEYMEMNLADKFFAIGYRPERIYRSERTDVLRPQNWSTEKPIDYASLAAPQDQNPTLLFHMDGSQDQIDTAVKRGTNMLFHRGHGAIDQWLVPGYSYDAQRFASFPQSMPPVVFAVSCLTGFFDSETIHEGHILDSTSDLAQSNPDEHYLAEDIVLNPKGALGMIASSRQSSWGYNDRLTDGLSRSLIDRKVDENTPLSQRLGDIMTDSKVFAKKAKTAIDPKYLEAANRHHMLAYNLFGDPSVEIRQALPLRVRGQPTLLYDQEKSQLTVRFKIESPACPGCDLKQQREQPIVVLMKNSRPISRGIAYPIVLETGENREVVLEQVTDFDRDSYTLYLSNAGLATFQYETRPGA